VFQIPEEDGDPPKHLRIRERRYFCAIYMCVCVCVCVSVCVGFMNDKFSHNVRSE